MVQICDYRCLYLHYQLWWYKYKLDYMYVLVKFDQHTICWWNLNKSRTATDAYLYTIKCDGINISWITCRFWSSLINTLYWWNLNKSRTDSHAGWPQIKYWRWWKCWNYQSDVINTPNHYQIHSPSSPGNQYDPSMKYNRLQTRSLFLLIKIGDTYLTLTTPLIISKIILMQFINLVHHKHLV